MLFLKRRRLYFWLVKAYIKKWQKTIVFCFIFGLIFFFILRSLFAYFSNKVPFIHRTIVGIVGTYTTDSIPDEILRKASRGLTFIDTDGTPKPDVASSWEIEDNGKKYVFHLKKGISFSDGSKLDSKSIKYSFLDVKEQRPDKNTIVYILKDSYAPFLATVSRPIFKNNFTGVGEYKIKAVNLNGNFIQSIDLASRKNDYKIISYQMYPTEDSLKTAYALGEITIASGLSNLDFQKINFSIFKNTVVKKNEDNRHLVTVFYNNQDKILSDKRIRQALTYALPEKFAEGMRSFGPLVSNSWVGQDFSLTNQQDIEHAKTLLENADSATKGATLKIELKTLPKFKKTADELVKYWSVLGIKTEIVIVQGMPTSYQAFLADFRIPIDPDQYTLWHSEQQNNITNYKNLRIDKLLEDGRKTVDVSKRQKIYSDFQKYLLDDAPASFLYFPYTYDITRKN
jgi:peptide/nickel transport system substrate-binding protein